MLVASADTEWVDTTDGLREFRIGRQVDPAWRRRGIGSWLQRMLEEHAAELSAAYPDRAAGRCSARWAADVERDRIALLNRFGFEPARYFFDMVRPTLDEIEEPALPDGLEFRPLATTSSGSSGTPTSRPSCDHWGGFDSSEENFTQWKSDPKFDPSLFVIAWDGDEIAGGVLNEINETENTAFNRQRGWLQQRLRSTPVASARAWARGGAPLTAGACATAGMTSAGLGVDADNPTGALGLYTGPASRSSFRSTAYRKPMPAESHMIETDRELERLAAEAPGYRRPASSAACACPMTSSRCPRCTTARRSPTASTSASRPRIGSSWFAHPIRIRSDDRLPGRRARRPDRGLRQARAEDDNDGGRNYTAGGEVDPHDSRAAASGAPCLRHNIRHQAGSGRARSGGRSAAGKPRSRCGWRAGPFESQSRRRRLLESEGFAVVRWFFEMLRPDLDDIADLPMPEGLEIRPVGPEDYRKIFEADVEAFRDHWGAMEEGENAFQRFFGGPDFRPELWRVAWDGDEVAGVVHEPGHDHLQ